jgi:hypothetical protein
MKEYVARHSSEEGYLVSRLPEFGQVWVDYIKGKVAKSQPMISSIKLVIRHF